MSSASRSFLCWAMVWATTLLAGCAVVAVADAAVTVTATVVKTGVQATAAVVNAVIPD